MIQSDTSLGSTICVLNFYLKRGWHWKCAIQVQNVATSSFQEKGCCCKRTLDDSNLRIS